MSYAFGMFFKNCTSKEDAYETARKVAELCLKHSKEVIEDAQYYIPSIRLGNISDKTQKRMEYAANKNWLYSLFSLNFVYWEKYNLLGMSGYDYPKEMIIFFDAHHSFQNSTDHNYEFETWSDDIPLFIELKEKCQTISAKEILDYYTSKDKDWYTEEEVEEILDYERKSVLYDMVFDTLDLNDWLYGRPGKNFFRFSMNAITCQEDIFSLELQMDDILGR